MKRLPAEDLANESRSTHITVAADMVFSLSHYLSGVSCIVVTSLRRLMGPITDCYRRVRSSPERRVMGRDSVIRPVTTPSSLQSAEAGRHFILQHEPHSYRVVKSLGHSRAAL